MSRALLFRLKISRIFVEPHMHWFEYLFLICFYWFASFKCRWRKGGSWYLMQIFLLFRGSDNIWQFKGMWWDSWSSSECSRQWQIQWLCTFSRNDWSKTSDLWLRSKLPGKGYSQRCYHYKWLFIGAWYVN